MGLRHFCTAWISETSSFILKRPFAEENDEAGGITAEGDEEDEEVEAEEEKEEDRHGDGRAGEEFLVLLTIRS